MIPLRKIEISVPETTWLAVETYAAQAGILPDTIVAVALFDIFQDEVLEIERQRMTPGGAEVVES